MTTTDNLAPRSTAAQLPAQVARRIEYARATGVQLDDGNVIDYLADNMTRASLVELRVALGRTIYAKDFPKAIGCPNCGDFEPLRRAGALCFNCNG